MKKVMMLGAALMALQAIPAMAQDGGPAHEGPGGKHHGGPAKFFEKLDADKDGSVSEAEFLDAHKKKFAEMDIDKDGKVTKEELEARHAEMKKKWDAKKAEMKAKRGEHKIDDAPPAPPAKAE